MTTPAHIVPEWYLLPFYAILRAFPDKLLGVLAMFSSIAVLFFVPWLGTSPVRSARIRPLYRNFFWLQVAACLALGYCGAKPPEGSYLLASRIAALYYFADFLLVLPALGVVENPRPPKLGRLNADVARRA